MNDSFLDVDFFSNYSNRVQENLKNSDWTNVSKLANDMLDCWRLGNVIYLCGNGGSAGNAVHLANDFLYGVAKSIGKGMRVNALTANSSLITCLANDVGYESIFSEQLATLANKGDLLVVFSGSGNSPNILKVLEQAKIMEVKSYAIVGFDGGKSKLMADIAIHFPVFDMQISEDFQLIVGHMLMQWLKKKTALDL